MIITNLPKLNFKGRIIDSHVHCGKWTNDTFSTNDVMQFLDKKYNNGQDTIDRVVISNLDCVLRAENDSPYKDEIQGNLVLLKECQNNDRLLLLVVCQPGWGSADNVEFLIKSYPDLIKGLKFHPACLNLAANDFRYIPYMEVAQKYNLPCLFHSEVMTDADGNYIDNGVSDPKLIYETARHFPTVPVILGHLGLGGSYANEVAIDTLINSIENNDAKLYADLAWVDWDDPSKPHVVEVLNRLLNTSKGDKTERLLFGTDAPLGAFGEKALLQDGAYEKNIQEIKRAISDNFPDDANRIMGKVFYGNSKQLFSGNLNKTV